MEGIKAHAKRSEECLCCIWVLSGPKCSTNSVVELEIALLKQSAGDKAGGKRVLEQGSGAMSKGAGSG